MFVAHTFSVSAHLVYQVCFILSSTFLRTFRSFSTAYSQTRYFVFVIFSMTLEYLTRFLFYCQVLFEVLFSDFSIFIEKQAFFTLQIFCFFVLSCECLIILSGIFLSVNTFFYIFLTFLSFSVFSLFLASVCLPLWLFSFLHKSRFHIFIVHHFSSNLFLCLQ